MSEDDDTPRWVIFNGPNANGHHQLLVLDINWWEDNKVEINEWFEDNCPESKPSLISTMINFQQSSDLISWRLRWE